MLGFVDFDAGDILNAASVDGVLRQGIVYFADPSSRDAGFVGVLEEGLHCYTADGDGHWYYNGSEWVLLSSAWETYTPAWTNLTVGNGTVVATRRYENGAIHCRGQITFGGTTSIGGNISQTIPDSQTTDTWGGSGTGLVNDSGAPRPIVVHAAPGGTSWTFISDAGAVNATVPSVLATGDVITWDIVIGVV
jgi:hypothetical protein